ncbi:hypothetical protein [Vampirovibrio sp.]|uniref:hypothetical protein n=1 Tax=Vampirovibrio sp. TaxID=2717857 RepID=UPI0035943F95
MTIKFQKKISTHENLVLIGLAALMFLIVEIALVAILLNFSTPNIEVLTSFYLLKNIAVYSYSPLGCALLTYFFLRNIDSFYINESGFLLGFSEKIPLATFSWEEITEVKAINDSKYILHINSDKKTLFRRTKEILFPLENETYFIDFIKKHSPENHCIRKILENRDI